MYRCIVRDHGRVLLVQDGFASRADAKAFGESFPGTGFEIVDLGGCSGASCEEV